MNKLYTAQEVADRLKIKKTTVYELIKRNELESSKMVLPQISVFFFYYPKLCDKI